jgi:rhodanese-related sulfurtransferase
MFESLFGLKRRAIIPQINAQELYVRRQAGDELLLVDVRTPREYEFDGHVEGSRLLPLSMLQQRMHELPKDKTLVLVCRSGSRSQTACEILANAGYENVTNLRGGMNDWKRNGLPFHQGGH